MNLATEAFNTKQAAELTAVPEHQLRNWDRTGVVKPSFSPASGRGSRRLYSYADLLALMAVRRFREQGLSLQSIRKCVRYLRQKLPEITQPLGFCTFLTDGNSIYLLTDEQMLIDTVRDQGQLAFIQLNVAAIEHALRQRVLRFARECTLNVTVADETYQVQVEPDLEDGGFIATVPYLPGCVTQGETLDEVEEMARDAIATWLEGERELAERGVTVKRGTRRVRSA